MKQYLNDNRKMVVLLYSKSISLYLLLATLEFVIMIISKSLSYKFY